MTYVVEDTAGLRGGWDRIHANLGSKVDSGACISLVESAAYAVDRRRTVAVALHDEVLDVDGIDLPDLLHGLEAVDDDARATVSRVEDAAIINDEGVVQLPEFLWHRWEDAQRKLDQIAALRDALEFAKTA
ncbi:hypothetical protein HJ588_04055 [Flexivirga sp. ID2601S]|uniref:Uncharacterized protein n=1 Tax=Flexivirga aerilata TaxID=1656889 RepID=A0A849AGW1_9MICO|nr:hypothetical protein [Flexivirga aerilata]NNG38448.1 hypothetical protein [Flexivirga aerilata]